MAISYKLNELSYFTTSLHFKIFPLLYICCNNITLTTCKAFLNYCWCFLFGLFLKLNSCKHNLQILAWRRSMWNDCNFVSKTEIFHGKNGNGKLWQCNSVQTYFTGSSTYVLHNRDIFKYVRLYVVKWSLGIKKI